MTIFLIGKHESPTTDSISAVRSPFADFSAVGTWVDDGSRCDACGWHGQSLREPLLVEWEAGGDQTGDFSWDGPFGYLGLVTENVVNFFHDYDYGCAFHPVEYVAAEHAAGSPSVPCPYVGPKQLWMESTRFVHLDLDASNVSIKLSCEKCGRVKYSFCNQGIVIPKSNWNGEKIFRLRENGPSFATFATDEARREIEAQGFSNVSFTPAGKIMD